MLNSLYIFLLRKTSIYKDFNKCRNKKVAINRRRHRAPKWINSYLPTRNLKESHNKTSLQKQKATNLVPNQKLKLLNYLEYKQCVTEEEKDLERP